MANLSICLEECDDIESYHHDTTSTFLNSIINSPNKIPFTTTNPEISYKKGKKEINDCYIFDKNCKYIKKSIEPSHEEICQEESIKRRQSIDSFESNYTLSSSDISEYNRSYSIDSNDTDLSTYTTSEGSVSPRTLDKCKKGEIPRPVLRRTQARRFSEEELEDLILTPEHAYNF